VTAAASGRRARPLAPDSIFVIVLAGAMLLPAVINGFPLIFPDTGTYLSIALGNDYAADRSSFYGFFLKLTTSWIPGTAGLWTAVALQCLLVAIVVTAVAKRIAPASGRLALFAAVLLTPVAFHVAQLMPDAFTGIAVLLAWLAARRDLSKDGTVLLWVAVSAVALTHYTHLALVAAAATATLIGEFLLGIPWRRLRWRLAAATASVAAAALVQIAFNGLVLGQRSVAPMGPMFLYARLNQDGQIKPWLQRHCGHDAPEAICALAPKLPDNSQRLLWAADSPLRQVVWKLDSNKIGWDVIAAMDIANKGAIAQAPFRFVRNSAKATVRQFLSFAPLDDECPATCRTGGGGVEQTLQQFRPGSVPALDSSLQVTDRTPKAIIRAIMTPVAALALLLLPLAGWQAWRRRDRESFTFVLAIFTALVTNAALAGALSDVHDRYQSRIVWLAPLALFLLIARWNIAGVLRTAIANRCRAAGRLKLAQR